jgi:hypothetical protein
MKLIAMIEDRNVIQDLVQRLDDFEINWKEDDNWFYTEAPEQGFPVALTIEPKNERSYIVFYGDGYHEHFHAMSKAIDFFIAGLSGNRRLRVEYWGEKPCRWFLEQQAEGDEWQVIGESGTLFRPFWKKRTIKYFRNNMLK